MSFLADDECLSLYNKIHTIEIGNGYNSEERTINITVKKECHGGLVVKIRDENSFLFSYSTTIDRKTFMKIKKEQALDIDFDEFETHLLDMLLATINKQMFLKCELNSDGANCNLILYEKSRIKSLIFLTIELFITNQKQLFEEMETNIKILQETNKNLNRQLTNLGDKLRTKEKHYLEHMMVTKELKEKFMKELENVNKVFLYYLRQCETSLVEKVQELSNKILKMISDINIVKGENHLKSTSSARLLSSMESLRVEYLENISVISKLKMELSDCERKNKDLEAEVLRLLESNKEKEAKMVELNNKVEEYRNDLQQSALMLVKKNDLYIELKQDMEQANQVIRNYNKHYDLKAKEVEDLKEVISSKDRLIKEQILQNNKLFKEYHEYKSNFNSEDREILLNKLSETQNKLEIVEKEKRELLKLNGLLTKKLSATNLFMDSNN